MRLGEVSSFPNLADLGLFAVNVAEAETFFPVYSLNFTGEDLQ